MKEIESVPNAELNLVIDPDYGRSVADFCRKEYGTPFIDIMPIGFDAIDSWIKETCRALGKDPSEALDDLRYWRRRTAVKIDSVSKRYVKIRGRTFSVSGSPALASSVTSFIYSYLGLVPVAVDTGDEKAEMPPGLKVSSDVWDTCTDVMFGSGNEIASCMYRGICIGGSEILEPSLRPVSITDRPLFGTMGSVRMIEDVLNILMRSSDRL